MEDETRSERQPPNETLQKMYAAAQRAIEAIARESVERTPDPDWVGIIRFYGSLTTESDRAVPVLAFAYIENEIQRSLQSALNPSVSGGMKALFGPVGPLGAASANINMAHALYWISDTVASELHILRGIRNSYAHGWMAADLDSSDVARRILTHGSFNGTMAALLGPDNLQLDWSQQTQPITETFRTLYPNVRNRIIVASALSAWSVASQLYVGPQVQRHGVSPNALLSADAAEAPDGIRSRDAEFKGFMNTMLNVLCHPGRLSTEPDLVEWASSFDFVEQAD